MLGENELGFRELLRKSIVDGIRIEIPVILKGQYRTAYDLLKDSIDAGVTPCLVGPPGVGKSLLLGKSQRTPPEVIMRCFLMKT